MLSGPVVRCMTDEEKQFCERLTLQLHAAAKASVSNRPKKFVRP